MAADAEGNVPVTVPEVVTALQEFLRARKYLEAAGVPIPMPKDLASVCFEVARDAGYRFYDGPAASQLSESVSEKSGAKQDKGQFVEQASNTVQSDGRSVIELVFDLYAPGEEFSIDGVFKRLSSVKSSVTRNAVTQALARGVERKHLVKRDGPGEYARPLATDVPEGSGPTDGSEGPPSDDTESQEEPATLM